MPFQSEKQRKYLWANEPAIARDWTDKYGSRVEKDNGGVMDLIKEYVGPSKAHMSDWGDALASKNPPWSTTPEYHQWAAENLATHGAENWNKISPVLGEMYKGLAPVAALGSSPFYDIPQAFWKYNQNPGKNDLN